MRILVLGAGGMLGHKLYQTLSQTWQEVYASFRQPFANYEHLDLFDKDRVIEGLDVTQSSRLFETLDEINPNVICNCIGMTTRKISDLQQSLVIELNSVLPHRLREWCVKHEARLIHFSTDCVFTGQKGHYTESDLPDASDLYGRSKILGEVTGPKILTLRSSIIGREIQHQTELVEWMLQQRAKSIRGYAQAHYTGLTTIEMSKVVHRLLRDHPQIEGLHQLASPVITKFDLLNEINQQFALGATIAKDSTYVSKKNLDGSRFTQLTNIEVSEWKTMIQEMKQDPTPYERWMSYGIAG